MVCTCLPSVKSDEWSWRKSVEDRVLALHVAELSFSLYIPSFPTRNDSCTHKESRVIPDYFWV